MREYSGQWKLMGITHANKTTVKTEQDSLILEGTLQQQLKQSTKFNEVINTTSKEASADFFLLANTFGKNSNFWAAQKTLVLRKKYLITGVEINAPWN